MADVMDRTGADGDLDEGCEPPMFGLREWLPDRRFFWDRSQEPWLRGLASLDRSEEWRVDGQLSCVDWIVWKMRVCRGTAFEWLRVAHELERRPVIAEALRAGDITYSAARAITRLDRPDREVDEKLVELAKTGPAVSLEQAIRYYQLCKKQEELPKHLCRFDRRGLYSHRQFNGLHVKSLVVDPVEDAEVEAAIKAFMDRDDVDDSTAVDDSGPDAPAGERQAVDDSTEVDDPSTDPPIEALSSWSQRRLDAFMDLIRTGLAHMNDGHATGADRYMVHAIIDTSADATRAGQLIDGTFLTESLAARIACDCSFVPQMVDGTEPLKLGRKTREWSTAQRRAITVRDGSRCRFPGCRRRVGDIHHVWHWEHGGPTDVGNGAYICTRHHTLLHQGFDAVGDTNRELVFYRPDGSALGTTTSPNRVPSLIPD